MPIEGIYNDGSTNREQPLAVDAKGRLMVGGLSASITNIPTGTADAQGIAGQANLRLLGFSINESAATAAAASLILRHGAAATDPEIMDLTLAADGQTDRWFGPDGISIPNGLFVDRVSGETKLTLYTKVA